MLSREKCFKEYENIRFHFGNFRTFIESYGYKEDATNIFDVLSNLIILWREDDIDFFEINDEWVRFQKMKKELTVGILWDYFQNFPKISKVTNLRVKEFIQKKLSELEIPKLDESVYYYDSPIVSNFALNLGSLLMDTYLLNRLFRTFDISKGKIKYLTVDKAVIIAGDVHIQRYLEFLCSSENNNLIYSSHDVDSATYQQHMSWGKYVGGKCIDVSLLPSEFFEFDKKNLVASVEKSISNKLWKKIYSDTIKEDELTDHINKLKILKIDRDVITNKNKIDVVLYFSLVNYFKDNKILETVQINASFNYYLFKMLSEKTTITELNCSGVAMEITKNPDTLVSYRRINENNRIILLNFSNSSLGYMEINNLFTVNLPSIETIDISGNKCIYREAHELRYLIKNSETLKLLKFMKDDSSHSLRM